MKEGDLEVTYPVFYVEELLDEKQILYPPANENSPLVEISDSSIEYPEAGQGVLVKVVSSDLEQLPYQIVLKFNGETYEGAVSYYFDTISGNFEKGYYIIPVLLWRSLEQMLPWRLPACYTGILPQSLKLQKNRNRLYCL